MIHDPESCKKQCPGGLDCCCNGRVRHTLHICSAPDCECHSLERYGIIAQRPQTQADKGLAAYHAMKEEWPETGEWQW